jgi:hypothetical protein
VCPFYQKWVVAAFYWKKDKVTKADVCVGDHATTYKKFCDKWTETSPGFLSVASVLLTVLALV